MGKQLPKKDHAAMKRLCAEADELVAAGHQQAAIEKYREAWALIPEDKENWEASTWILTATGDVVFVMGDYPKALTLFQRAVQGPGGLGNPYIHLRLGQIYFETGNKDAAADELARAYMGAGDDIYKDSDPKYFAFLKTRLKPPPGGWKSNG